MFTLARKMMRTHRKHIPSSQTQELTPENVIVLDREFLHTNQKIWSVLRLSLMSYAWAKWQLLSFENHKFENECVQKQNKMQD